VILVDTSIWIDHFRRGNAALAGLLESGLVCTHNFVIGELASSNLRSRAEVPGLMQALPRLVSATEEEALRFIEERQLMGRGIGYIDVHLLAATIIEGARFWTKDGSLKGVAEQTGCGHPT